LLSNDAHDTYHFCLVQASVMNINKRTRTSASPQDCRRPFCPFTNGFCSKICSSKRLLERFEDFAMR